MTRHGIENTQADWWIHILPVRGVVLGYSVSDMKSWISKNRLCEVTCRAGTGGGYLVRTNLPFIKVKEIPKDLLDYIPKPNAVSDEEVGITGEYIVAQMLQRGLIFPNKERPWRAASIEWQFAGVDWISNDDFRVEIKTERYNSGRIWVQTWEHLHDTGHIPTMVSERK